jgi:hypothetical protein
MTLTPDALRALLLAYKDAEAAYKAKLAEADSIIEQLLASGFLPGTALSVDGDVFTMRDNFADGNAIWRPARVRRYTIESDSKQNAERKRKR